MSETISLQTFDGDAGGLHPIGLHKFLITSWEEKTFREDFGPSLIFTCESDKGRINHFVSKKYSINTKTGKKAKLVEFSEWVFGQAPADLNLDEFVGKSFQGMVQHVQKGDKLRDVLVAGIPMGSNDPFVGQ